MPFASIIGHARIVELLKLAIARGRQPQSLLFAGPDGVGKRAVALAFAQAVNCPRRSVDGDACGTCQTCVRIARGQHSDVTVLDKGDEASIKIEPLRVRILEVVGYRPFEAARRVFIIDPADALTAQAQDALLKTLEEPPSSAILILVTSRPDALLPTIQSRCRRVRFGPLSEADVERVLVERLKVDRTKARMLAAPSGGSVGRALAGDDNDFDKDRDAALALIGAARTGDVLRRLKAATDLAKHGSKRRDREAMSARLVITMSLLRDLGAIGAGTSAPLANLDIEDQLRDLSGAFNLERAAAAFAALTQARENLRSNASPKIVADWVAMAL